LCLGRLLLGRPSGPDIGLTDALIPLRARAHDGMSDHRSDCGGGGGGDGERHGETSWWFESTSSTRERQRPEPTFFWRKIRSAAPTGNLCSHFSPLLRL